MDGIKKRQPHFTIVGRIGINCLLIALTDISKKQKNDNFVKTVFYLCSSNIEKIKKWENIIFYTIKNEGHIAQKIRQRKHLHEDRMYHKKNII